MKNYIQLSRLILLGLFLSIFSSCDEKVLEEVPLSFISPDNAYSTKDAFENGITALHSFARDEQNITLRNGEQMFYEMSFGTDVAQMGERYNAGPERFWDYTLVTPFHPTSAAYWEWAYKQLINNSNLIISRAENPKIVWSEAEKNAVIAEAKFFRAYTYNILVNIFGGVPLVTIEISSVKLDFVRTSRLEVLKQVQQDLEFAAQWLPINEKADGRISQGAANHLLSEVYISLGQESKDALFYDKSIAAASKVIDSGKYKLMTTRFGAKKALRGDVYSDLFWDYNVNRGSGNTETIWAMQYEYLTNGGGGGSSNWNRAWGSRIFDLKDPAGKPGMMVSDSTGRPVSFLRPTNLVFYDVWVYDNKDMRNSKYNIRRDFYWNNPSSAYFGQKVQITSTMDTIWIIYPTLRKIEGDFKASGAASGNTPKDIYIMRLAETYLLRAEAYMWKGDLVKSAADLNIVRSRALAKPVLPADVNIDFILDERVRELIVEEPRRRTLVRLGKLYERTKKYNFMSGKTIKPFNELMPIPQSAIDANFGAELKQNPGY